MSTTPNDPAQLLASLLKGGQHSRPTRGRVSAEPAADDPVARFTTLARQMSADAAAVRATGDRVLDRGTELDGVDR